MHTLPYRILATLVLITQFASLTTVSADTESASGEILTPETTIITESVTNSDTGVTTREDAPIAVAPDLVVPETTTGANIPTLDEITTETPIETIKDSSENTFLLTEISEGTLTTDDTAPAKPEIIVEFQENIDLETYMGSYQAEAIVENAGHTVEDIIPEMNMLVVGVAETGSIIEKITSSETSEKLSETITTAALMEAYSDDSRILRVQPNYLYEYHAVIDDTRYSEQWSLHNIGQTVNTTTGTSDADIDYPEALDNLSGASLTGVIVAVLDSGIYYDHPEFRGKLWDGSNCRSYTGGTLGGCLYGYDFYYGDTDPFGQGVSHGTNVASVIAATTNNGTGVAGIASNAKIMAVKVCGSLGCYTSDIIKGIQFAEVNGARVINASFGGARTLSGVSDLDWAYHDAIEQFSGILVTSAGNESTDNNTIYNFPTAFGRALTLSGEINSGGAIIYSGNVIIPALSNIISVAATDANDAISWFSNTGSMSVDIAAPGENILTAHTGTTVTSTGYISTGSGWVKDGQHASFWYENYNASGSQIALWTDARAPYASGANTTLSKVYNFPYTTDMQMDMTLWCDTPTSTGYTDYLEIAYSTGGAYTTLRQIDEDYLSIFGTEFVWSGGYYTGSVGTISPSFAGSGNVTLRMRWITDSIDQLDESGNPHYGCYILSTTTERRTDRGITGGYRFVSGTSFSAPHVAGALALGMGYLPTASGTLLKQILLDTGDSIASHSGQTRTGKRLNLANFIETLDVPQATAPLITPLTYDSIAVSYTLSKSGTGRLYASTLSGSLGQSGTLVHAFSNATGGTYTMTGLLSDTTYYFQNESEHPYFSGSTSTISQYHTPKILSYTETGTVTSTTSIYLSGSTATGITYGDNGSGRLILESIKAGYTNPIRLSFFLSGTHIFTNHIGWDGIVSTIRSMNTATITLTNNTVLSIEHVVSSPNIGTLSGNAATLQVPMPYTDGMLADVYISATGGLYTLSSTCTISGGYCTLTGITSLSGQLIAFSRPRTPTIVNTGVVAGPGGGGGSSSSSANSSNTTPTKDPFIVTPRNDLIRLDIKTTSGSTSISLKDISEKSNTLNILKQDSTIDIATPLITYLDTNSTLYRGAKLVLLDRNIHALQSILRTTSTKSQNYTTLWSSLKHLLERKIELISTEFMK